MESQPLENKWVDLLKGIEASSWLDVISLLFYKNHGYSNYKNCLKRDYLQIKEEVLNDHKVRNYLECSDKNKKKVDRVLNEMCHLLSIQSNPTRKLKFAGGPFLKCITKIYSSIYVNSDLFSCTADRITKDMSIFKKQYLEISKEMPIVILPTHRSYMDFLFITYIMFINELPLPIVAAGDNFKAMGRILLDYLKGTGAFVVRRNASNKKDIEATAYYDILRAYVHSILSGGENPLEFFMEGTRTRVGQVLRPKTGLLSMVVDSYLKGGVEDICIMPVSISYQRPIEEQLYVAENTPQIDIEKPKENAKNLVRALESMVKRRYGKVYVKFIQPIKLSEFHDDWKINTHHVINQEENILHELTNSLATKVCLAQAYNNVLMPFNLMTYSMLSKSFLSGDDSSNQDNSHTISIPIVDIAHDFRLLEDLLAKSQSDFIPGWRSHKDIIDEFKIDRDGIIRSSEDRKFVEFDYDVRTFHTMLYYSNQVMQILLPVALCLFLEKDTHNSVSEYRKLRQLLSVEFLSHELSMDEEYTNSTALIKNQKVTVDLRKMIENHLVYLVKCYISFLNCLRENKKISRDDCLNGKSFEKQQNLYISKDMIKNMFTLVKEMNICKSSLVVKEPVKPPKSVSRIQTDEVIELEDEQGLTSLIDRFQQVLNLSKASTTLH